MRKIWGITVRLWAYARREQIAYQRFLVLLAESPAEWMIRPDGFIRSYEDECPLVEVYQRLTGMRGLISDHATAYSAADFIGLSQRQASLIIHAADSWYGFSKELRIRNDLLRATRAQFKAQEDPECAEWVSV